MLNQITEPLLKTNLIDILLKLILIEEISDDNLIIISQIKALWKYI